MKKKIISLLLILAMSLMHIVAFADDDEILEYLKSELKTYESIDEMEASREIYVEELMSAHGKTEDDSEQLFDYFIETQKTASENNTVSENTETERLVEEEKKPEFDSDTEAKLNVLKQLKIIDNEEFLATHKITRGEFARYIANLVNYGSDYSATEGYYSFNDVTKENVNYAAIALLINKGAVIGVGEGLYMPDEQITVNQVCTIIVRLMGYDFIALPNDENDIYYFNKANEINLLKGVALTRTDALDAENAVEILFNALDAKVVTMEIQGAKNYIYTDQTFLNEYMELEYAEGIVTANSKTSLASSKYAVPENALMIGETEYYFEDIDNLDEYLGKKVRVYYDMEETYEAKAIMVLDKHNEILTVNASEIERFDTKNNRLYYFKDDENKEKYESILMDTSIIFNGIAVDYETNKSLLFTPDVGEITFIDNNKDSKADVVLITSYVYYIAKPINETSKVLYDKLNIQPSFDLEEDNVKMMSDMSEIIEDRLIMAAPSRVKYTQVNGVYYTYADVENSELITVEAVNYGIEGTIKGKYTEEDMLVIDDKEILLSGSFISAANAFPDSLDIKIPSIGAVISAKLDKYGHIALITVKSYGGLKYGFVKRIIEENEGSEKYIAKIYTQDNEHIKIYLADKVTVHMNWTASSVLNTSTYYARRVAPDVFIKANGGKFEREMVKFALDREGLLNEIYVADKSNAVTPATAGTNFNFMLDDSIFALCWYKNDGETDVNNLMRINGNTTVRFKIPEDSGAGEEQYAVLLAGDTTSSITPEEYYDVNRDGTVGCAVEYIAELPHTGKFNYTTHSIAVVAGNLTEVWDFEKEEIGYSIDLYVQVKESRTSFGTAKVTYQFENPDLLSHTYNSLWSEKGKIPISKLKKGDILQITTDESGKKIIGFLVIENSLGVKDESGNLECGTWNMSAGGDNRGVSVATNIASTPISEFTRFVKGYVEESYGELLFVNDGTGIYRRISVAPYYGRKARIYIYEKNSNEITIGTYTDIQKGDYIAFRVDKWVPVVVIVRDYE